MTTSDTRRLAGPTLLVTVALLLAPPALHAQQGDNSRVGTTAAAFLQIGMGARAVAMGETAVASAADVSALYWNPALLTQLDQSQAYFSYVDWFVGIDLNYGSVMLDLGSAGRVAATAYVLSSGEMEVTTEVRQEGTGERFEVQNLMLGLTYSRALTDRFAIGGTAKLVREAIWNMSAATGALDVGLTYRTPFEPVTLGLSIANFGGKMRMAGPDNVVPTDLDEEAGGSNDGLLAALQTEGWDLPVTFRIGASYQVFDTRFNQLLLTTEALYPNSNANYLNTGFEYGVMGIFYARAGYRQLLLEDREGGLTAGGGIHYMGIQADYAYADRGMLDAVHYVSLAVNF